MNNNPPNYYSIKPEELQINQIFYKNMGQEKFQVLEKPVLDKFICTVKVKDEIGNIIYLKFNTSVESNLWVTKLSKEWKKIF